MSNCRKSCCEFHGVIDCQQGRLCPDRAPTLQRPMPPLTKAVMAVIHDRSVRDGLKACLLSVAVVFVLASFAYLAFSR